MAKKVVATLKSGKGREKNLPKWLKWLKDQEVLIRLKKKLYM